MRRLHEGCADFFRRRLTCPLIQTLQLREQAGSISLIRAEKPTFSQQLLLNPIKSKVPCPPLAVYLAARDINLDLFPFLSELVELLVQQLYPH